MISAKAPLKSSKLRKRTKVPQACSRCRYKKMKCNGHYPCSRCVQSKVECSFKSGANDNNESSVYNNTAKIQNEIESIDTSLRRLKSHFPQGRNTLHDLEDAIGKLTKDVQDQYNAHLNLEEVARFSGEKSIETHLLDRGALKPNDFCSFDTAESPRKPLNIYFGLYSPLLLISAQGGGWLIRALLSKSSDCEMKLTVFLFLKFLDSHGTVSEIEQKASNVSPLEGYLIRNHLKPFEDPLMFCLTKALSIIPNFSTEPGIGNDSSYTLIFKTTVLLLQQHQELLKASSLNPQKVNLFFEEDSLISSLNYELFERTLFIGMPDLENLKTLLSLISLRYPLDFNLETGKLVSTICRLALDLGLDRWEYNIGRTEEDANQRRQVWWQCCWWDKWYATISGKAFLLTEDTALSLFPRELAKIHVDSSMTVYDLLCSYHHDALDVECSLSFGYILLVKLIEEVQKTILYSRKFTHFSIFSTRSLMNFHDTIGELLARAHRISEIFGLLDKTFLQFLTGNTGNSAVFELYLHMQAVRIICAQAIGCQLTKLQNVSPKQVVPKIRDVSQNLKANLLATFDETMKTLLAQNKSYIFVRYAWYITVLFLCAVRIMVEKSQPNALNTLSLICCVANRASQAILYGRDDAETSKRTSRNTWHPLMLLIISRICCLVFMKDHNMKKDELCSKLAEVGPDCAQAAIVALNSNDQAFNNLKSSDRISFLREAILQEVKMQIRDFEDDKVFEEEMDYGAFSVLDAENDISNFLSDVDFQSLEALLYMNRAEDLLDLS
ncbi:LADA_0E09538g1_1 [Lachancea dasiensis]|uniref:LADA_0E09538g1_1 n=1 Tax=Lachancea dasiensis TaxID=1072105 RepID=A0A1G4JDT1_9SACH|nr:LADA_0E09538g1_1 [Lachancea dasiensis]